MMLTMKLKTMETELAETRRLLSESREQEVSLKLEFEMRIPDTHYTRL